MLCLEGYHVATAGDPNSGMLYFRNLEVKKFMDRFFKFYLTLLITLFLLMFMHTNVSSEESRLYIKINNRQVSANIKNTPLKKVIDQIKQEKNIWFNTGFIQDASLLDNDISVRFGNVNMKEGLDRILSGINYSIFFEGNKVVGVMLFGEPGKRSYRGRGGTRRSPVRRSSRRVRRRP
jgi:hypothetical protein